mgnify:CR=1 FL=1|tara:strand:+ start:257 stop:598 length:342 start_codon:yes stop_codon:yes gene_type:complete
MEKRIIVNQIGKEKELVAEYSCGNVVGKLDEIIDFLIDAKNSGATHIEFDGVTEYDCNTCLEELTIKTVTITEESDKDFLKRKKELEISAQNSLMWTKNLELQELARLKKKYE